MIILKEYEETFRKIKQVYIIAFITYLMLARIVPFVNLISRDVNTFIFSSFAVAGAMILCVEFLMTAFVFKCRENLILLSFLIVCIVSSVCNIKYGIVNNIKTIVWTAIQFFVLFSVANIKNDSEIKKVINIIIKISSAIWCVAVVTSIVQFFFHVGYISQFSDYSRRQGFVDARLFGIFTDPNFAAITSLLIITFCCYLLKESTNKTIRIYYCINIAFQVIYVVLSGSRTGMIEGALLAFMLMFFESRNRGYERGENRVNIKAFIKGLIAIGVSLALIITIQSVMVKLAQADKDVKDENLIVNSEDEEITLKREDITEENISNGRFEIWRDALKISADNRLLGLSPRNLVPYAKANYPDSIIAVKGYETHNGYLAVLVGTGITGTLVMLLFVTYMVYNLALYFKQIKKRVINQEIILLISVLFIIAASAFLLLDIFFVNTYGAAVFWLFAGYLLYYIRQETNVRSDYE